MKATNKAAAIVSTVGFLMGGGLVAATSASSAVPTAIAQNQSTALSISRDSARQVAVRHIERRTGQQARATGSGRENDNGAQWEIEVTTRNGREFDVYVNSRGKVVKVLRKGKSKPWKPNNSSPRANTSRAKAKRVAVRHIERRTGQQARATWSGRENDNGAQWEIEVTTGNGREFDVYVSSRGKVVKVVRNGGPKKSKPAPSPTRSPATDGSRESAKQIAVAHMQREFGMGARVTWSGREDDFGAQWEIEVTLADGREFDVYVNSAGEVVRVR